MPSAPVFPSFDHVRLASLKDLDRIATVAASGFFWSPTFKFQRPYYRQWPEDTVQSYWEEYRDTILDPASVVLVVEDAPRDDELEHVYEALRHSPAYSSRPSASSSQIVVGVCSLSLRPGSPYIGRFQSGTDGDLSAMRAGPSSLNRDQSEEALQLYNSTTSPAKARHLTGLTRVSTLCVHPAYWRRGKAWCLLNWCTRLADQEGVPMGISAAPMGAPIAAKAGFEEQEVILIRMATVPAGLRHVDAEDVELSVAVRSPCGSPSDESATSETPTIESQ